MKKIFFGLLFILSITGCSTNDRYGYSFSLWDDEVSAMLVDKKTGTVWIYHNRRWRNYGTPPVELPNKGDYTYRGPGHKK